MTDEVLIRPEVPSDHAAIRRVVARAFGSDAEADLVDAIRRSPEFVADMALVATIGGTVVGHVMISGAVLRAADGERRIVMLSPLAVDPHHQRRGIGGDLVRTATSIADDLGEPLVVLEGDPGYYRRLGFEHSVPHGIEIPLPDWAPAAAAQVLRLRTYDPDLRGDVVYPAAFDGL